MIAHPKHAGPLPAVRRRYHLHLPGVVYAAVAVFTAVGAINSQNNLLFWLFGVAVAGLILSGFVSGSALMGVQVEREPIAESAVGGAVVIRYTVRNRNRFVPACALTITESQAVRRGHAAPTWTAHLPQPMAFVAHVGPRQAVHAEAIVSPTRRGEATFSRITVSSAFPFGLTRKSVTFEQPQGAIVHPSPAPIRHGLLRTLRPRGDGNAAALRSAGVGGEYYGLREYSPGDSHRLIAWRASARTGQLVVRQTSRPAPRRLWIVLDLAPETESHETADPLREEAVSLAAGVATAAFEYGYAVGLSIGGRGTRLAARSGRSALRALLTELALFDAPSLSPPGGQPAAPPPGRSDAFVVISERNAPGLLMPGGAMKLSADKPEAWIASGAGQKAQSPDGVPGQ
ncbi:MAG TPA: DUF58 domain-containing protein [Phycisphaerales bacterium]|nr:DUF58 domain-containing protein [Phycisphaerales bacterium]